MDSLRRASGALFYLLGLLTILGIVLVQRGVTVPFLATFLNIVDLPLLLTGMLFGGSTLITSVGREKMSTGLIVAVFLPLLLAFSFFAYLNFSMPFPE